MKKHLILLLLLLPSTMHAQNMCTLFTQNQNPILWLGVDFSHMYLPPSFNKQLEIEHLNKDTLQHYLFERVNTVICREYKKYDPGAMFRTSALLDTSGINEINRNIQIDDLFINPEDTLEMEDIQSIVSEYTLSQNHGFAVALIAERFEIKKNRIVFHIVVIDAGNNQVVLHERMLANREFTTIRQTTWNSVYVLMHQIQRSKYNEWKKKFCS